MFPIFSEFEGGQPAQLLHVVRSALAVCLTLYLAVGFFGALTFGPATHGDVLKNYGALSGATIRGMEIIFAISVALTFPTLMFPLREPVGFQIVAPATMESFTSI